MRIYTETTGSHPLLLEFAAPSDGRMIGELKNDLGVYDQLIAGRHLDAPESIPVGAHHASDNGWIFGQSHAR